MDEGRAATPPPGDEEPASSSWTQQQLNAECGKARAQGRLDLAKEFGFDSLEELYAAVTEMKAWQSEQEEPAEAAGEEAEVWRRRIADAEAEMQALSVEREALLQAATLGGDRSKLDAILKLREKTGDDVLIDGTPNPEAIRASVEEVFERYPDKVGAGLAELL